MRMVERVSHNIFRADQLTISIFLADPSNDASNLQVADAFRILLLHLNEAPEIPGTICTFLPTRTGYEGAGNLITCNCVSA